MKEEKVVEIEEFQIIDVEEFRKTLKKDSKFDKYFKGDEPFSKLVGKLAFVVGHALESIQFDSDKKCWYIDTRAYDLVQTNVVLTTHYYRWEFTDPLPKKLLKHIPFDIEIAKTAPIIVGTDKVFKMPVMSGFVVKVSELCTDGLVGKKVHKDLFVVKNPEIID